jgi:hypothetical protein
MLSLVLDSGSPYEVRWPSSNDKILELAAAYIAFEQEQQANPVPAPSLSQVQAAYDIASSASQNAESAETTRATAAEDLRQAMEEAMPLLRLAIVQLRAKYYNNLAQLQAWGLETRQSTRGVSVLSPARPIFWRQFLTAYVNKEQSLEPSQRLSEPDLTTLQTLQARVEASQADRTEARASRSIQLNTRTEQLRRLSDLLQIAAGVLVATRYDLSISRELQQWGFTVVERK